MPDNREVLAVAILGLASIVGLIKATGAKLEVEDGIVSIKPGNFGGPPRRGGKRRKPTNKNDGVPIPGRKPNLTTLDEIYIKYALIHGMDWRLLKAIAKVESSERPTAKNAADPSYGLMQILCVTPAGNQLTRCTNKFNIVGWDKATPESLLDPDFNVSLASQILQWNLQNYGFPKGIAVYNAWSARNDPPNGPFRNQGYVDKVLSAYRSLGGNVGNTADI